MLEPQYIKSDGKNNYQVEPVAELVARIELPDWARGLFEPRRYKVIYGGRAGGKTYAMARALLLIGMQRSVRIASVREVWTSIRESTYQVFVDAIYLYGLNYRIEEGVVKGFYNIKKRWIEGANGTYIFFMGLSDRTHANIRGLENVNFLWYDEAQQMQSKTAESLYPSVRAPGSEIWFSFNPNLWSDPVCQHFLQPSARRADAWVKKVSFFDNPWLPAEMMTEQRLFMMDQPERYAHVWGGEADLDGEKKKVLPESLIRLVLNAWPLRKNAHLAMNGRLNAGLDVADTGNSRNVLAIRSGAIIHDAKVRYSEFLGDTARWANALCKSEGVSRLYYDAGGIGGAIRSYMRDINPQGYSLKPILFGGEPNGGKSYYSYNVTNRQFFSYINSQLAWNLRLRAINTQALINGYRDVDPRACLFINPDIPNLNQIIAELSQPEWRTNVKDQIVIDKQPETDDDSPDYYDAIALSFAHDIRNGLEEGKRKV